MTLKQSEKKIQLRILLIINGEFELEVNKMMFNEFNHYTYGTCHYEEALELFTEFYDKKLPFDLVFTDYGLEKNNGMDLARQLYAIDKDITTILFPSKKTEKNLDKINEFNGKIKYFKGSMTPGDYKKIFNDASEKRKVKKELEPCCAAGSC